MTDKHIVIGSRGSDLALWQAHHVQSLLARSAPLVTTEIKIITTTGDTVLDTSLALLGGKGVFTKEIEVSLLNGEIDLAVHSMKDLPTMMDPKLVIAAIPERGPIEDCYLSLDHATPLMEVRQGAVIATGSLRRSAQLLHLRPDIRIVDIRGNVPTRIRKLIDSDWDGMILARAGVDRLGLQEHVVHTISTEWMLPAVGQGALALQVRAEDSAIRTIIALLDDTITHQGVLAERAFLAEMGGGCQVPIAAHATILLDVLELRGLIVSPDGRSIIRGEKSGYPEDAELVGSQLGRALLDQGGREILNSLESTL